MNKKILYSIITVAAILGIVGSIYGYQYHQKEMAASSSRLAQSISIKKEKAAKSSSIKKAKVAAKKLAKEKSISTARSESILAGQSESQNMDQSTSENNSTQTSSVASSSNQQVNTPETDLAKYMETHPVTPAVQKVQNGMDVQQALEETYRETPNLMTAGEIQTMMQNKNN